MMYFSVSDTGIFTRLNIYHYIYYICAYATHRHSNPTSMQDVCHIEPSLMALAPTSPLYLSMHHHKLYIMYLSC